MSGRRTVIGLCMLCALAVSAVAAQGASAAGTTAYTVGGTSIANGVTTELSGTGGEAELKSKASGVALALTATSASPVGIGTMVNSEPGSEMISSGTGTILFEGVAVAAPAGKGCSVVGGQVETKPLTATTAGQGMFLKFAPASGNVFAEFTITGCSVGALNKVYKVEGSVKGVPSGTETLFSESETTGQGTMTLGGQSAGIEGSLSLTARASSSESFTALEAKT